MRNWKFSFIFSFILVFGPSLAWAKVCASVHGKSGVDSSPDTGIYFVIPLMVGSGQLKDTMQLLPAFREGGVKNIWLGPIHPQTRKSFGVHGKNDHGYWPSDHSKVALGGEASFIRLIQEAQVKGVGIWMDAVIGHFGYGDKVIVNGKTYPLQESEYFRVPPKGSPLIDPKMLELSAKLDQSKNRIEILALQKEIAKIPIFHLPKIRHENSEMANYLIESYGRFIDLGVTGFRIDAAKHIDLDFLKRFVRELQVRGIRRNGKAPEFLFEFTLSSSQTLDLFINYIRSGALDPSVIYAIDFPMAYELRRLENPHFRFDWLMGFIYYRWQHKLSLRHLIPFVENHDFESALQDPFTIKLAYGIADFFSGQSPIISHGLESTSRTNSNNRSKIKKVDSQADLLQMRKAISSALGNHRREVDPRNFNVVSADKDFLLAERKLDGNGILVLIVNKSTDVSEDFHIQLQPGEVGKVIYQTENAGKAEVLPNTGKFKVELNPQSFFLIEKRMEKVP